MFLQIKHNFIEQNLHSVAGVLHQRWDLGVLGGSKTLALGFAMYILVGTFMLTFV